MPWPTTRSARCVASLDNWGEQLAMFYVDDPIKNPHYYLTNDYWSTTNLPLLINTRQELRARSLGLRLQA